MRSTSMWLSCAAHVALAAGSAAWLSLRRGTLFSAPENDRLYPLVPEAGKLLAGGGARFWLGMTAALFAAVLTVHATRVLVAQTRWARALHITLRGSLLGATPSQMLLLAGTSACAEELFFRALLGSGVGFVSSSAIFGILHGVRRQSPLAVAAWSFGMGLVFSGLYLASGTLLAPMLAHCVINYENMQYICNYDPTPLDMDRFSVSGESEPEG
jgi:membrane protease YdiL (CAAX protease family)